MRTFTYPEEFQAFWALHPRGPKRKAFDAYRKAVSNGVTADGVAEALKAYRRTLRDDFLGVHLFRWLRDERWQEQEGVKSGGTPPGDHGPGIWAEPEDLAPGGIFYRGPDDA